MRRITKKSLSEESFQRRLGRPALPSRGGKPYYEKIAFLYYVILFSAKPVLFSYYVISRNRRDVPGVPRLTRGGHTHLNDGGIGQGSDR